MKSFDMKDMGEAHYVLGIEIIRNKRFEPWDYHKRDTLKGY